MMGVFGGGESEGARVGFVFNQEVLGDEVVDVFSDGGDGAVAEGGHDFAVTGRVVVGCEEFFDKIKKFFLLFCGHTLLLL